MLNRRFAGPIAATFQGHPPGVARLALSLSSAGFANRDIQDATTMAVTPAELLRTVIARDDLDGDRQGRPRQLTRPMSTAPPPGAVCRTGVDEIGYPTRVQVPSSPCCRYWHGSLPTECSWKLWSSDAIAYVQV